MLDDLPCLQDSQEPYTDALTDCIICKCLAVYADMTYMLYLQLAVLLAVAVCCLAAQVIHMLIHML